MSGDPLPLDLARFHAGDEGLFTALVREYSPRLRPYLRRFAAPDIDAHDLLQEVWLLAFRKRHTFEGRGSLLGWLLMVSRTVGMAAARKRRREPVTEELHDIDLAVAGNQETVLSGDLWRNAVLALPERQRDVLLLRLVEGLSTAETAQVLQCAEGTVKATLHQATRKLQSLLKETVQ